MNNEQEIEIINESVIEELDIQELGEQIIEVEDDNTPIVMNHDYNILKNKPSINGIELSGNKTLEELDIVQYDDSEIKQELNNMDIEISNLSENMNNINRNVDTNTDNINDLEHKYNTINEELVDQERVLDYIVENKADAKTTYTKQEVDDLIGTIENVKIKVVEDLPEIGETNVIYFVHRIEPDFDDVYNEYVWENNKYELIGNTLIDLTNYVTDGKLIGYLNNFYTKQECNTNYEPKLPNSVDYSFQQVTYGNGESGYRKYKNGMLEQWGVTTSNVNGDAEFTMHQPHIDQNFSVFVEPREMGNFFHYALPSGNQKFRCRIQSRDSISLAIKFQWRSFGKWK